MLYFFLGSWFVLISTAALSHDSPGPFWVLTLTVPESGALPEVALAANLRVRREEFDMWPLDHGLEVRVLPCCTHTEMATKKTP